VAAVGSLNATLGLNSSGFTSGLKQAQASTTSFVGGMKKSANSLFDLGGGLGVATKGFGLLKGVAAGFGFSIAGSVVPELIKGVRSLFGWNEAAEKAAEGTKAFIKSLRDQNEEIGKTVGEMAALKAARIGASEADQRLAASLAEDNEKDKGRFKEQAEAAARIEKLKEEIATLGMSAEAAELYRLQKSRATVETKARIEALLKEKSALEAAAEAEKEAAAAAVKAAEDKSRAMEKQQALVLGIRDKFAEYMQSMGDLRPQGGAFGSREARARIDQINSGTGGRSLLEKLTQEEINELKKHGDLLRNIRRAIEDGSDEVELGTAWF
jgi:hypothetical protein